MKRQTTLATLLAISLAINLVLGVFAFVQKETNDASFELATNSAEEARNRARLAEAQLGECDSRRARAEQMLEECEQKVLAFSNRK